MRNDYEKATPARDECRPQVKLSLTVGQRLEMKIAAVEEQLDQLKSFRAKISKNLYSMEIEEIRGAMDVCY